MLIKNALILKPEFLEAFHSLMVMKMPAKQCLEVSTCIEDIMAQYQILTRARKAIADKYCKKDPEGRPMSDADGNLVFESEELHKKCVAELKEVYEEEIDIPISGKIKIPATELMTPSRLMLLKDVIEIDEKRAV